MHLIDPSACLLRPGEFEGRWGTPARWWRQLKLYVPQLSVLDPLPHFTFVAIFALILARLLVKFLL